MLLRKGSQNKNCIVLIIPPPPLILTVPSKNSGNLIALWAENDSPNSKTQIVWQKYRILYKDIIMITKILVNILKNDFLLPALQNLSTKL